MTDQETTTVMERLWPGRFVNHRLHLCGCETSFDQDLWQSKTWKRCDEHEAIWQHHYGEGGA